MFHRLVFLLIFASTAAEGATLTLRDGLNGHFSTEDTYLHIGFPTSNFGSNGRIVTDAGGVHGLLRYSNLVGAGPNQVPLGATIIAATLTLHITNTSTTDPTVHQMLVDWDENLTTWNNAASLSGGNGTAGIQADGIDAVLAPAATIAAGTLGDTAVDITALVQSWVSGDPNYGLAILTSSTDGVEFASSQEAFNVRPLLEIEFAGVPVPSAFWLAALGLAALRISRGRCVARSAR